jgi:rod shape determining protein RodA
LDLNSERIKNFRYVILFALYAAIPAFLIFIEPDLGSSLVIFFVWLGMLFVSKVNKKHLAILFLILIAGSLFSWFFLAQDYQKARIYTFINPSIDPQGSGYNVLQSMIAVGSGSITGRGANQSMAGVCLCTLIASVVKVLWFFRSQLMGQKFSRSVWSQT